MLLRSLKNIQICNTSVRKILNPFRLLNRSNSDQCHSKPILMQPNCKNVVITGIGGIALATAQQLLLEKAKRIALIGLDTKRGAEVIEYLNCSFGKSRAIFYKCDVRNKIDVEDTMKKIKVEFDEIDIVVNSVGVWDDLRYQDEMQTNLGGTMNVVVAAKDHVQKGDGVVINIAGFAGLEPFPNSAPFAAFASGIIHFSRSFGHDVNFKRFGVRVVALCVGLTKTKLLNDLQNRMLTKEMGKDLGEFLKAACSQKPEACGKAVVELVKYGPTGSVWLVAGSRLFYYDVPCYQDYLRLVSQFV